MHPILSSHLNGEIHFPKIYIYIYNFIYNYDITFHTFIKTRRCSRSFRYIKMIAPIISSTVFFATLNRAANRINVEEQIQFNASSNEVSGKFIPWFNFVHFDVVQNMRKKRLLWIFHENKIYINIILCIVNLNICWSMLNLPLYTELNEKSKISMHTKSLHFISL